MIVEPLIRSTPEAEGIPSRVFEDFIVGLQQLVGSRGEMHGYMVLRHGKVISEATWQPYSADEPHQLCSLTKNYVSAAIGIAQGEGLLSIDDTLVSFFPEYDSDAICERMRRVTIRHLLTMTFGHAECALTHHRNLGVTCGWVKRILEDDDLPYEPGTHFAYNSACTHMLSAIIHKVTGENFDAYLRPRVLDKLGFGPFKCECSADGIAWGGQGMWLTMEEEAAFGQLWLQQGAWNGEQLIPRDYVVTATSLQKENAPEQEGHTPDWCHGYGFQLWMCRNNCFRGDGYGGQFMYILPEYDLVVVTMAGTNHYQGQIDVVNQVLVPAIQNKELPENDEALEALRDRELALELPMVAVSELRHALPFAIYEMAENALGLKTLTIAPSDDGDAVMLLMDFGNRKADFLAGFDGDLTTHTAFVYPDPVDVVARAAWVSENEFVVSVFPMGVMSLFTLTFKTDGETLNYHQKTAVWFRSPKLVDVATSGKQIKDFKA